VKFGNNKYYFKNMSRIGKKLIQIPPTVKVDILGETMTVSGPKGELKINLHRNVKVNIENGNILVTPKKVLSKKEMGIWGLYRALIFNMVEGVSNGFTKKLELEGIGYKAAVVEDSLVLNLGFVNPVKIKKPVGIDFLVEKNVITVSGISKEVVGQIAAEIRETKKAEPYKGKGIKYQGEKIRRKEGKKVVASKG